ncbi:Crp/Fnr family transcriptional regulator [Hymenobacter sp. B81]|uniref:Crp/Fnr family transcriptional regulator n=1 Tax=Hymenobacter sp. B81 TaxID=3344878 RepID=UPI0037DDD4D6
MTDHVLHLLAQYLPLTAAEADAVVAHGLIQHMPAGTVLLREGAVARACYLVLQGCVRSYFLLEGQEKTAAFYTEGQPLLTVSYTTQQPAAHYLVCAEDCWLLSGSPAGNQALFERYPRLETLGRLISSALLAETQTTLDSYRNLSPQQRYLQLLQTRPELVRRVPQYHLASYLGIQPESLSRIRRRLQREQA